MADPVNTDYQITKTEVFDADAYNTIMRCESASKIEKDKLKKYHKHRFNGNHVKCSYNFGKDWRKEQVGVIVSNGLSSFDREIRAFLARRYYFDVDMANSQPVLLVELCKRNGWKCDTLEHYVKMRKEVFDSLMTELEIPKREAKDTCIECCFGSKQWLMKENEFLKALTLEMMVITENHAILHPHLVKRCEKLKKSRPKSAALAIYVQDEQRKCLMAIDAYLKTQDRDMDVLIHDGGLVRKLANEEQFPEELLRGAEEAVLGKLKYAIRLEVKPLESTFNDIIISKRNKVAPEILVNDAYAAKRFVELLGENIILDKSQGRFLFDETTGLWTQDETTLKRWLNKFSWELTFYQDTLVGEVARDYAGSERNICAMMKNIDRYLAPIDFVKGWAGSSIGKLLWENGVYNFDTDTFTPGFDKSILFFGKINRKFPVQRDAELEKYVHKIFFEDPYLVEQQEQAMFYKTGIARAIYGDYRAKRCYFTVGQANCGKGLLTGALMASFENYVMSFNTNNLLYNPRESGDTAKAYSWLAPIINSRICIGNEISMINKCMDSNRLKSISSGGDEITLRQNFQDETQIVCRSTPFCQLNDMPPIKPVDEAIKNRMCVNEMKKTYKANPDSNNPLEAQEDRTLKDYVETEPAKNALFYILVDAWKAFVANDRKSEKPAAVVEAFAEWAENGSSIASLLEDTYEITKNEEDYVVTRELITFLREKGCKDSDTKIGRILVSMGCSKKDMKVNGSTRRMTIGIKRIEG
jgi:hypothetical protein